MRRAIAVAVGALALAIAVAGPATASVKVFFPRGEQLVGVNRPGTTAEDAVRALLRGPTSAERRAGYRTYIPRGTALRGMGVVGDRATVGLGVKLMQGAKAEGLNAPLAQIVYTATGARPVRSAKVLIQGGTVLGVFPGIDASVPLTRDALATPTGPPPGPVNPSSGDATAATRALQTRLIELGFLSEGSADGRLGPRTTTGVLALQKWARLGRDGDAGPATLAALATATRPAPITSADGRRVEVLLDRQLVLAIDGGGVGRVIHVSSGAAATPTPPGSFAVARKDARKANVNFSVPYLTADQGVLLSLQTTARPAAIADLRGLKLCAQKGSTGADLVTGAVRPTTAPLLPATVVVLTRGLRSGRCEAVVFDAPALATLRAQVPNRFGPFAGVIATGENYGVVFPKGSRLRGPVNRALAALKADGTIAGLQKRWLTGDLTKLPTLR